MLDGANVARFGDGKKKVANLLAAIAYFQQKQQHSNNHTKCVAFVPQNWVDSDAEEQQQQLVAQTSIVLTASDSEDDLFMIDYAVRHDGFVVTNDLFRDHVKNEVGGLCVSLVMMTSSDAWGFVVAQVWR